MINIKPTIKALLLGTILMGGVDNGYAAAGAASSDYGFGGERRPGCYQHIRNELTRIRNELTCADRDWTLIPENVKEYQALMAQIGDGTIKDAECIAKIHDYGRFLARRCKRFLVEGTIQFIFLYKLGSAMEEDEESGDESD